MPRAAARTAAPEWHKGKTGLQERRGRGRVRGVIGRPGHSVVARPPTAAALLQEQAPGCCAQAWLRASPRKSRPRENISLRQSWQPVASSGLAYSWSASLLAPAAGATLSPRCGACISRDGRTHSSGRCCRCAACTMVTAAEKMACRCCRAAAVGWPELRSRVSTTVPPGPAACVCCAAACCTPADAGCCTSCVGDCGAAAPVAGCCARCATCAATAAAATAAIAVAASCGSCGTVAAAQRRRQTCCQMCCTSFLVTGLTRYSSAPFCTAAATASSWSTDDITAGAEAAARLAVHHACANKEGGATDQRQGQGQALAEEGEQNTH